MFAQLFEKNVVKSLTINTRNAAYITLVSGIK